ncbi:hypothetical protein SYNPS1DRAFT_17572 [Syncephalis pseudoplumigaleata]|uniref:Uncharacterized protein n=1 Tax=Syncephalis pseudoplumigaleata TaxID=1712513 RepID=A0A4P9YXA0_9FUNG|nr:hypothetical protein SYNPS1DRAFT_17572 [Syncephalis pseudoplumigaleata]|eukprot:RKP24152.1 hypothetical protein SYNPS1DRAFT_17572 [Syncephalis pseudoplumigaleata]
MNSGGSAGSSSGRAGASANPFANASYQSPPNHAPASSTTGSAGTRVNKYETSLPLRVDVEAALVYLLGCFSGVFFLICEQKNDYVRFHAWQSCLIFAPLTLVYVIFALISSVLATLLLIASIVWIAFLMLQAYKNGSSLSRFSVPVVGPLAMRWTDSE